MTVEPSLRLMPTDVQSRSICTITVKTILRNGWLNNNSAVGFQPYTQHNKSFQVSCDCVPLIKSLFSQVVAIARPPELRRYVAYLLLAMRELRLYKLSLLLPLIVS